MATGGGEHGTSSSQYSLKNERNESLGFTYESPKFSKFSKEAKRLETLQQLPSDHPIHKENLSAAGFFKDKGNIICYFCGGGVEKWERGEDARIEHARHFPKCGFLKLKFGQKFIDIVQELNEKGEQITIEMVESKMGVPLSRFSEDYTLRRHSAGETNIAITRATNLTESRRPLSDQALYRQLENEGRNRQGPDPENDICLSNLEKQKRLEEENAELCRQIQCIICKDKRRSILFDPCRHLVCCIECAPCQEKCPKCDQSIKARVAAKICSASKS